MGMKLHELRTRARLSCAEIAVALGYKSSTIVNMWESGTRKIPSDKLPDIARILGCTVDDLYEYDKAN